MELLLALLLRLLLEPVRELVGELVKRCGLLDLRSMVTPRRVLLSLLSR